MTASASLTALFPSVADALALGVVLATAVAVAVAGGVASAVALAMALTGAALSMGAAATSALSAHRVFVVDHDAPLYASALAQCTSPGDRVAGDSPHESEPAHNTKATTAPIRP